MDEKPNVDPMNDSGNNFKVSFKLIFPDRMKARVLVSDPVELASLFVPSAI